MTAAPAIGIPMNDYVLVLVSAALVNHLILHRAPVSRLWIHVLGASTALLTLLGLPLGKLLHDQVWMTLGLQDMQLFLFLPLLALLAWAMAYALKRIQPTWPLEGLPLWLLCNSLVLGFLLQVTQANDRWLAVWGWGVIGGLGFWLALALFDDLRQRSDHPDIPNALRGLPIELVGAGVMAMAFSGFNGLFTQ
jgi:electron transport complex protein RnfA